MKDTDIEYYYYVYDITYNSEEVLEERKEKNEIQLQKKFGDAYDILGAYEDKLTKEQRIVHRDGYEKKARKTARLLIDRGIRSRDKLK
ncbi:hypothetical protein MT361_08450 [Clostridium butyricum]|nr:hypothetical protein [Clostridium butyricum]MDI9208577.1 hypothetical protein [Clostridium butyricum]